jgi:hypothetical protein
MKNLISTVPTSLFSLQRFCFHIIQMGSPCGKDLCGRLRKNNVFPAGEISPFVKLVGTVEIKFFIFLSRFSVIY